MLDLGGSASKLGLVGDADLNSAVFFIKNDSIFARKQGDFISGYSSRQNTVFGVNGPSFRSNSDFNTAIGYQSANSGTFNKSSVFLGSGAGYDSRNENSILIGKKSIVVSGNETIYEYRNTINVGTDTTLGFSDETVSMGNNVRNFNKDRPNVKLSRNTLLGHGNINYSNDAILMGYKNLNNAKKSVVIGKNVENYGDNSLLIYPKNEEGNSIEFVNNSDNYLNIFGVITGSNNTLNFRHDIDFQSNTRFHDNAEFAKNIDISNNLHVHNNVVIDSNITSLSNITDTLLVNSNATISSNLHVHSNLYIDNELYVHSNIFLRGSNIYDIMEEKSSNIYVLSNMINDLSSEVSSEIKNSLAAIESKLYDESDISSQSYGALSNLIRLNARDIDYNEDQIEQVKIRQEELLVILNDTVETQIEAQFNSIVQKAIDGTYIFNVVRDSITHFPKFTNSSLSNYERMIFDTRVPNTSPVLFLFPDTDNFWEYETAKIEQEDQSMYLTSIQTSNALFHTSNVFKNDTYFIDRAIFSNNVACNSNLFIKGVIQSFSNQVTINDSLLVQDALHVSDFIQTNAIKCDYNFNNNLKVFSNLTFGDSTFSNDWKVFTAENPNNSNLRDLIFKGMNEGSEGIETTFTDFIPGQLNFTGQHRCTFSNNLLNLPENLEGYIVSSTGIYRDLDDKEQISIDDAIPIVKLSEEANDSKVFGVISNREDLAFPTNDNRRCFQIGTLKFKTDIKKTNKIIVNSVGEGGILVCNQNGNIKNGDLIVTSDKPGIGMKQKDDIIRNSTVAKATCDAIFYDDSNVEFIGCIYKI